MLFGLTNSPAMLMELMNRVFKDCLDTFVIELTVDIPVYSKTDLEHDIYIESYVVM